jgi:hypothetical protein
MGAVTGVAGEFWRRGCSPDTLMKVMLYSFASTFINNLSESEQLGTY